VLSLYDFSLPGIDGETVPLSRFRGSVCLVVNVASKCGLTPQYDGLQRLYETYRDRGFEVLGFPCNQFAGQEPGSDADVKAFCTRSYGVTFPLFSKLEVNGAGRSPLYAWLTAEEAPPGGRGDIEWNFAKFLVDRSGHVVGRFPPQVEPEARDLKQAIEGALG
jgi:glutathione peroxidase